MSIEQLMQGMTAEDLGPKRFLRVHYTCDPDKDKSWAEKERALEADPRNWEKQMEMRRVVTDGIPVFSRYNDALHCPRWTHEDYLPLFSTVDDNGEKHYPSLYYGGWDAGQTLSPAFLLRELTPDLMVRDIIEVVSITGESMDEFAPRVKEILGQIYPQIINQIRHYGDATITTRNGSNKVTAQQTARRYGFEIKEGTNDWSKRKSSIDLILNLGLPDNPRYIVSGKGCPVLRRGYQGMYKYQVGAQGEGHGAGAIILSPLKNGYSHIQDAGQYCGLPLFDILKPKETKPKLTRLSQGGFV